MHPVSEVEIAEITKIAENAHRYLQIAFAEELYLYCQANNIKFSETLLLLYNYGNFVSMGVFNMFLALIHSKEFFCTNRTSKSPSHIIWHFYLPIIGQAIINIFAQSSMLL